MKKYKEKWWERITFPVYRFFKFRWVWSMKEGFANLWRWRAIVWKDRPYDDYFLWAVLHHKLELMEKHFHPSNELELDFVGRENVFDQISAARQALERVVDDDYNSADEIEAIAVGADLPVERDIQMAMDLIAKHGRQWWV